MHIFDGMEAAASTPGCLPFFGPAKLLVVVLYTYMETQPSFQWQTFVSLIAKLQPDALILCSTAYMLTFHFNAAS
jgi:hypothetical protein